VVVDEDDGDDILVKLIPEIPESTGNSSKIISNKLPHITALISIDMFTGKNPSAESKIHCLTGIGYLQF
jgi:hypothetical protein